MKSKIFLVFLLLISIFVFCFPPKFSIVFASPTSTLFETNTAEKILQNLDEFNTNELNLDEFSEIFDALCTENTQYFSYKIEEISKFLNIYKEKILENSRLLAQKGQYEEAVELLTKNRKIFADSGIVDTKIAYYRQFFVQNGLYLSKFPPTILSINKLIAYPQKAFENNSKSDEYEENYLLSKEFLEILNQLYSKNYVLVNIFDYLGTKNENVVKKDLFLPKDKKPLILIFDDLNYFENEQGFVEKYVLDSGENLACFSSRQSNANQLTYDTDLIVLLENFLSEHPDFSHNNARGVLSFSKDFGILGYNISKNCPNFNQNVINLKEISAKLKNLGYVFALKNFEEENEKSPKFDEIVEIFGQIHIIYGENFAKLDYKILKDAGIFVIIKQGQSNCLVKNGLANVYATKICGKFLREKNNSLPLDYEKIYDHNNRKKLF